MAEQSRELAKYDAGAMPPLEIPRAEPVAPVAPPFNPSGRVRWTPRRVRRMVPSKLKEVVVAILGAMEDPPRRGAARRRRLPGPDRWPPVAPAVAPIPAVCDNVAPVDSEPVSGTASGAAREGAD